MTITSFHKKIIVGFLIASGLLTACSKCNQKLGIPDDHVIEEIAEDLIEDHLALDLDLTPDSEESGE